MTDERINHNSNLIRKYIALSFLKRRFLFWVMPLSKCSFRRDSNPWSMDYWANSLPPSYLTCWWIGIKSSVYQVPNTLFTNRSSTSTQLSQNGKLWTISNKNSSINSNYTTVTDVFLMKMWQEISVGFANILGLLYVYCIKYTHKRCTVIEAFKAHHILGLNVILVGIAETWD